MKNIRWVSLCKKGEHVFVKIWPNVFSSTNAEHFDALFCHDAFTSATGITIQPGRPERIQFSGTLVDDGDSDKTFFWAARDKCWEFDCLIGLYMGKEPRLSGQGKFSSIWPARSAFVPVTSFESITGLTIAPGECKKVSFSAQIVE